MHHMGISLYGHVFFHPYRSYPADFPDIVSSQIHQHIMLRTFLFILQQLSFQFFIFFRSGSSGPGSRERKGIELISLQLYKRFRGGSCYFNAVAGKIEHIGRRIYCAQQPVGIKQASFHIRIQPVGQHHLENIPFPDMVLRLLHHAAVFLTAEKLPESGAKLQRRDIRLSSVPNQIRHILQFFHRFVIGALQSIRFRVDNQNYFLSVVIKGNYFVKEHEIHILKAFRILGIQLQ